MSKLKRDLRKEFDLINKLEEYNEHIFTILNKTNQYQECTLIKQGKKYQVKTTDDILKNNFYSSDKFPNINETTIKLNTKLAIQITSSQLRYHSDFIEFDVYQWTLKKFPTKNELKLFKLIIKSELDIRFDFYFVPIIRNIDFKDIAVISVDSAHSIIAWNGITFIFDSKNFIFYKMNDFFILECLSEISFESFDKFSRIILAAFGFLTSQMPGGCGYFFSYKNKRNNFEGLKFDATFLETHKTSFSIISLNPYNYFASPEEKKNEIRDLHTQLTPITKTIFSTLCDRMLQNENFSSAIFSILEADNNNSLLSRGALYSVILEQMTQIICFENEDKLFYIQDEKIRKAFKKVLLIEGKKFFDENNLKNFNDSPIKKKLDNINNPTNADKLTKPFSLLNINLNEEEMTIIHKRNDFLHGNNLVEGKNFSDSINELFYINLELNFLVKALILKYIGYSGKVRNLSKIHLGHINFKNLENTKDYKEI